MYYIELNESNQKLQNALDEVQTLQDIIPICSYCHSIRDGQGDWDALEAYISSHSAAKFSHGICPDCTSKAYEDAGINKPEK